MEEFSIFNIFTLLGGLAFFLYGMNVMSTGLEKLTGGKAWNGNHHCDTVIVGNDGNAGGFR